MAVLLMNRLQKRHVTPPYFLIAVDGAIRLTEIFILYNSYVLFFELDAPWNIIISIAWLIGGISTTMAW